MLVLQPYALALVGGEPCLEESNCLVVCLLGRVRRPGIIGKLENEAQAGEKHGEQKGDSKRGMIARTYKLVCWKRAEPWRSLSGLAGNASMILASDGFVCM
jgi:hypothetical protein